ncbi:hypothetical protein HK101_003770, partial [Irineochytrium annulatum]
MRVAARFLALAAIAVSAAFGSGSSEDWEIGPSVGGGPGAGVIAARDGNTTASGFPPLTVAFVVPPSFATAALPIFMQMFGAYLSYNVSGNNSFHPAIQNIKVTAVISKARYNAQIVAAGNAVGQMPGVVGAIGMAASNITGPLAATVSYYNLPVCDGASTVATLSDKLNYPNFFRPVSPDNLQALSILAFIKQQGWHTFNVLAGSDVYGQGIADQLMSGSPSYGLNMNTRFNYLTGTQDFTSYVKAIKATGVTVNVFCGLGSDFIVFATFAAPLGVFDKGNLWKDSRRSQIGQVITAPSALAAIGGVINFTPMEGQGPAFANFKSFWANLAKDKVNYPAAANGVVTYQMFFLNCIELYVHGFDRIIKNHPEAVPQPGGNWNLSQYVSIPQSFSFPDMVTETGNVILNSNGDRLGSYRISYFNATAKTFLPFALYDSVNGIQIQSTPYYNSFTAVKPSDTIQSCPIGYGFYSNGVTRNCLVCPRGTYNFDANNAGECTECPDKINCEGGMAVTVDAGYWVPPMTIVTGGGSGNASLGSNVTYLRTVIDVYSCPSQITCCPGGNCTLDAICAPGLSGLECTECSAPDTYMWGNQCLPCSKSLGASFWLLIFGTFIGACALLLVPEGETPTLEILFLYFQVVNYIYGGDLGGAIQLPHVDVFFSITSLNFDGMLTDCPVPLTGLGKLMFRYLLPSLLLIHISWIYVVLKLVQSRVSNSGSMMERLTPYYLKGQPMSLICLRAIGTMILFALMPLVETSLTILECGPLEGVSVVTKVPQVQCFSQPHIGPAAFAIFMLVILLGVLPALLGMLLYRISSCGQISYNVEEMSYGQRLLSTLYISFKPELFFMLPVIIIEKGVVCILFTLMTRYSDASQQNVHIIILAILCQTRVYFQPYGSPLEAYLNREICIGWLVLTAFREYTLNYAVELSTRTEITIVVFLPVVLHVIRWFWTNRGYHAELVEAIQSTGIASMANAHLTATTKQRRSTLTRSIEVLDKHQGSAIG